MQDFNYSFPLFCILHISASILKFSFYLIFHFSSKPGVQSLGSNDESDFEDESFRGESINDVLVVSKLLTVIIFMLHVNL